MSDFWLQVSTEYPNLSEAVTAVLGLLPFTATNLCELASRCDRNENNTKIGWTQAYLTIAGCA